MTPRTDGYITITFIFQKEGRRWTGCCKELGTATFGRSIGEAEKNLEEAVMLHLNTLEEVGERRRFFKEHSIEFHRKKPVEEFQIRAPITKREIFYRPFVQEIPATVN